MLVSMLESNELLADESWLLAWFCVAIAVGPDEFVTLFRLSILVLLLFEETGGASACLFA